MTHMIQMIMKLLFSRFLIGIILMGLCCPVLQAQEEEDSIELEGEEAFEGPWRMGLLVMHTYIPTKTTRGRETLILPSIGLDIEYWFSERWGIGMHNDIELESFEVEKEEKEIIERNLPVVLTLDGLWNVWDEWILVLGIGLEVEEEESFGLFRAGIEYEVPIAEGWDLSPSFAYDIRFDAFDTWSIGLGVGRRF